MQSIWHIALKKRLWFLLLLLFHLALLSMFLKCPSSSNKPTRFLLLLPDQPWLSPPFHPPSSLWAPRAPILTPLCSTPCWAGNLRAFRPQKGNRHRVVGWPTEAWKGKCTQRKISVNFVQWVSSNGSKGLEANSWAVTPVNLERVEGAGLEKACNFLRSCAFKRTSQLNPKQQGC